MLVQGVGRRGGWGWLCVLAVGLAACAPTAKPSASPGPMRVHGRWIVPAEGRSPWLIDLGVLGSDHPAVHSQDDGTFVCDIPKDMVAGRELVCLLTAVSTPEGADPLPGAVFALDTSVFDHDVGTIDLTRSAPVLVSGRVTTTTGEPIARAEVKATVGSSWTPSWMLATTDLDGRFEIQGTVLGDVGLTVQFVSGGLKSVAVSFVPGEEDVTLTPLQGLRGEVLVPSTLPVSDLELEISGPGIKEDDIVVSGESWTKFDDRLRFRPGREFGIYGLREGTFDLRLFLRDTGCVLAQVTDVQVRAGRDVVAPPLEFGGTVKSIEVTVQAPDGQAPEQGRVWVRGVDGRDQFRGYGLGPDGRVRVAHVAKSAEVAAHAPGMRYAIEHCSTDAIVLTLKEVAPRALPYCIAGDVPELRDDEHVYVKLTWQAPPDSPQPPNFLHAEDPWDDDPRSDVEVEIPFGRHSSGTTHVPEPGWYRITLCARRAGAFGMQSGDHDPVFVSPEGDPGELELNLSASELQKLVSKLRD